MLQVLADDGSSRPSSTRSPSAATPTATRRAPACTDTTIKVLKALLTDEYDKYHVVDHDAASVVTPMDGGSGPSPIEILMDTIADVNRIDASSTAPLDAATTTRTSCRRGRLHDDKTRGLEQLYTIIQNRPAK